MKKIFKIIIFLVVFFLFFISNVYAESLSLNIDYDGKKIEMTSETPNMEINIENLKSGESRENTIVLNSIGNKEVIAEFDGLVIDKAEYSEILNIKIINNKSSEIIYEGNITSFQKKEIKIPSKETNSINIITTFPVIAENAIDKIDCKINVKFVAKGEKNNNKNNQEGTENNIEYISTNIINPVKKAKSYVIFVTLGIMVFVLIILIIAYIKNK